MDPEGSPLSSVEGEHRTIKIQGGDLRAEQNVTRQQDGDSHTCWRSGELPGPSGAARGEGDVPLPSNILLPP
jgi:hypothetical protein